MLNTNNYFFSKNILLYLATTYFNITFHVEQMVRPDQKIVTSNMKINKV